MPAQIKPMAIKLPQEDRDRLKKLGEVKKRSAHWLAKEAITQFLDREEAVEQFKKETIDRWEDYCQTGKTASNDAVINWLDSWGTDKELEAPK
jgi:predicted transcriptional regulator